MTQLFCTDATKAMKFSFTKVVGGFAQGPCVEEFYHQLVPDLEKKHPSWVVVSNIFYFHPYLGKIPILTNIFQMG